MRQGWQLGCLVVGATVGLGCGDATNSAASASASAPVTLTSCSQDLPDNEREARCKEGETLCCVAFARSLNPQSPDYIGQLAMVCAGGDEGSCQKLRDAAVSPSQQLMAFDRACTKIARWPCRSAVMLSLLAAPDRATALIKNACRQGGEQTFRVGGFDLSCQTPDADALKSLSEKGAACAKGDVGECAAVADVDGSAELMLVAHALRARGLDADAALSKRSRKRPKLAGAEQRGRAVFKLTGASAGDKELQGRFDQAAQGEDLRLCMGSAVEADKATKPEKLQLAGTLDKGGQIAYLVNAAQDGETWLASCARGVLQDRQMADAGELRPFELELTLTP